MMNSQLSITVVLIAILSANSDIARGQDADASLALTFSYSPKKSMADLADGYKNHLKWHTANSDSIVWYAWFVVGGDRLGHFVDGAFDVTGAQFDSRPDPAGDAADATANFLPFAEMQYRRIFRLRKDLSTETFLEDRKPSSLMQVVYYQVDPGSQPQFEAAAGAIARAAVRYHLDYSIYEMLTGASGALYAVYFPLDGFVSFDDALVSLETIAQFALPEEEMILAMTELRLATTSVKSELWQYRADLSLMPNNN